MFCTYATTNVLGLEVGMRAVLQDAANMSAKDWRVVPLNWNENLFTTKRKLKIAYYEEDGIFTPIPGVQRGLRVLICSTKLHCFNESILHSRK